MLEFPAKTQLRKFLHLLPRRMRSWVLFVRAHHYIPNNYTPRTFNEIMNYRKLDEHDDRFASFSDKVAVKAMVHDILGAEYVTPVLYSGDDLPERAERDWPIPFVIKGNFGSNMNYFVRSERDLDWDLIELHISKWRTCTMHDFASEYWYDEIVRKIFVEPLIGPPDKSLPDYKFFVFGGEVEFVYVVSGRGSNAMTQDYFSPEWIPLDMSEGYEKSVVPPESPKHLKEMLRISRFLGRDFDFVRVDLYETEEGPVFGEMTFAPNAGYGKFSPRSIDYSLGKRWREAQDKIRDAKMTVV